MKLRLASILFLLIILLTECGDYWTIQRSEGFLNEKKKDRTIICINPQISFQIKDKNQDIELMQTLSAKFNSKILNFSRKNNIQLAIQNLNENSKPDYYDKLLLLKQNLIEVNFNNYSSVNSFGSSIENKLSKSVYIYPPKLSPDFNSYSKIFGTKYFSFLKVVIADGSFTFHHVLVDSDLAETVYSERKKINHSFNQALLSQVIYDSFASLSKEL